MASVVFYFQVHQPFRIKNYSIFSVGSDHDYFEIDSHDTLNRQILRKVANNAYIPTNNILLQLIQNYPEFKLSFSISGTALEQFSRYAPEVLDSFQALVDTGNVELLAETSHHSLAFIYSVDEFINQVETHKDQLKHYFDYTPTSFRNTELIYNNDVAIAAEDMGFKVVLAEGVDRILDGRSPNRVYRPRGTNTISLLLKNHKLSDDIAFRFSNSSWSEWPLTAEKYTRWLHQTSHQSDTINLFMDYETFGEHHWKDTGIHDFLASIPLAVNQLDSLQFSTVTEAVDGITLEETLDMPELTSWADSERDISAWISNPMQHTALTTLYKLKDHISNASDPNLLEDWRRLSTSDHFYYMSTKHLDDGQVHDYFSPYESPYDAFINYMNILHDLRQRV